MCRRPMLRGSSPWDTIQAIEEVKGSDGELLFVTTAGHGGIWIGPKLMPRFRKLFPEFQGYAGLPYLEEDCDWSMAVLAFPQFFDESQVTAAVRTVRGAPDYLTIGNAYLDTPGGQKLVAIADAYAETRATA